MTPDAPTPETDAFIHRLGDNLDYGDAEIACFARALERQRDAARAERDKLNADLCECRDQFESAVAANCKTIHEQRIALEKCATLFRLIEINERGMTYAGSMATRALGDLRETLERQP